MLALISALTAGLLIFLRSGPGFALVSVLLGYSAFVAYAYFRSRMWMKDPENSLAFAEGREPRRAVRIERTIASLTIPALAAFAASLILGQIL
ncbi:MAG: hypothetical protein WAN43_19030 [Rhodomicrobium sp.]|jgi:hypothetical protein